MKPILFITLMVIAVLETVAQQRPQTCITHFDAPPASFYYWPPDTNVKVYFERGLFTPEERRPLLTAMKTWSDTAAQTGAGISFSYAGEIDGLATCDGCLTVTRREVNKNNRQQYAFFNPGKKDSRSLLLSAWIDFDFATTKPKALQGLMAHELGHGMGLWDCRTCQKKRSIMNSFPGINKDNGLIGPSPCDLEVVRQIYQSQRKFDKSTVAAKE